MITILLATYNGEKYIAEQLDSLLSQTYQDFKVIVRDDCSTDGTYAILEDYAGKYPGKFNVSKNEVNTGGAKHNFIQMMIEYKDDYVMLCDQDDVWLPDKIKITLAKMKEAESDYGADTPLLVHTDLRVVDEKLETVSPSYRYAMNSNYQNTSLRHQVIQNTLTGCTCMYNRALADLVMEAPSFMIMHDWWLMLTAAAFGRIAPMETQTVLYRQHSQNEIGAKNVRTLKYKIRKLLDHQSIKVALNETYLQAQSLREVYADKLSTEQREFLRAYRDIPNHGKFGRWIKVCRLGVLKHGIARKVATFIFI